MENQTLLRGKKPGNFCLNRTDFKCDYCEKSTWNSDDGYIMSKGWDSPARVHVLMLAQIELAQVSIAV